MERGDVYFSSQYEFEDGVCAKKLLILLNSPAKDNCYLFVKTTSQKKSKRDTSGCHSNDRGQGYYHIRQKEDWFDVPTWVLFYPVIILSAEEVLKESLEKRNLKYMTRLKDITIRSISNCMKNSVHVSGYVGDLIG